MSDLSWTNVTVKLSDLLPWTGNPKTSTGKNAKQLQDSHDELGQFQTVAIEPTDKAGVYQVADGHQRLSAWLAKYGKAAEIDARLASRPLTETERRKIAIYSRQIGAWDWDVLSGWEPDELTGWGFDVDLLGEWGRDYSNLAEMLAADDDENGGGDGKTLASIYSQEQIIDVAFVWFRANGFPYRNLAPHVSMQEINKLLNTEREKLINTDTAYHVADTYHPHRFHASADGMKSPFDAFMYDSQLMRALRVEIESSGNIPQSYFSRLGLVGATTGAGGAAQACSNFRPGFAAHLYRKYCPPNATVLDTSTGYGGRLVGFIGSGIDGFYIGIDPNTETHAGNMRMAEELSFAEKIELHNLPAEDVPHEAVAGRCDFAFTSPPYFRKEHYSDEETQSWKRYQTGDDWRTGFLVPMMKLQYAALKPDSYAIVNIANVKIKNTVYPLVDWTKEAGVSAGFEFVRCDEFPLTHRFGANMVDEVAIEPVLVFRKAAYSEETVNDG